MILASWASSAALIAGLRASPAARPWAVGAGHFISGITGAMVVAYVWHDVPFQFFPVYGEYPLPFDPLWLIAPAVGIAVLGMLLAKALHPPAAANAAIPLLMGGGNPRPFLFVMVFGAAMLAALAAGMDWNDKRQREAQDAV
jgi:CBS-domain-containing membrane protein